MCYLHSQGLSGVTAAVYVAGVRSNHIEQGYDDPCRDDRYLMMILKGYTNETKPLTQGRKPLTLFYLSQLRRALAKKTLAEYDKIMLWSAFTLAFHGMLRVSEYTSPFLLKFSQTTLLRSDVELTESRLKVMLKRDKTHQRTQPPPIHLTRDDSDCCPVRSMWKYLQLRPETADFPLFVFKDGSFLTRQRVNKELRNNLGPKFTSHSFRIGAATTASHAGFTNEQIRVMGRWRSDVSNRYVRPDFIKMNYTMNKRTR